MRRELIKAGLSGEKVKYAHALIGRSIFIRYLEDRGILDEACFRKAARQRADWTAILKSDSAYSKSDFSENRFYYPNILRNKDFTYQLFRSLARDFNGDMFPNIDDEEKEVTQEHLNLVQGLLYGQTGRQLRLFFYSYRFDIVPLDLISSIYEEFYHSSIYEEDKKSKARQDGVFYTPPVLAEFVLSRTLTEEILKKKPRVLDPACGSGIFLVEAFRRLVCYKQLGKKAPLSFDDLKVILKKQIAGIEVNEEAARITAFSLYLSMLHYLDPPSIHEQIKMGNKLPKLLSTEKHIPKNRSEDDYHCIMVGDTFDLKKIQKHSIWRERFGGQCADVIVGNPPWGAPGNKADEETKARERVMLKWCKKHDKPIGNKEPSQAFLWRALDFLRDGGKAAMLVSAGVLFKQNTTTQDFRKQWLGSVRLEEVFNFTHVRDYFFKGVRSPFIAIRFAKENRNDLPVKYWSVKRMAVLKETQVVVLSKYDAHILRDENLSSSKPWKCYWFGRFADSRFLGWLQLKPRLGNYTDHDNTGRGYQLASRDTIANKLQDLNVLIKIESRYEKPILVSPPNRVHRFGAVGAYYGIRTFVNEGILERSQPKGIIIAQYSDISFGFYRSIYGIKFLEQEAWRHKTLLGIIWSSLARYYFFSTSANWGLWNHKLLLDELLQLPIILDESNPATAKVISIVDKLRNYHPRKQDIFHPDGVSEKEIETTRRKWEAELDEAVFELYGLNEEQKDLIRDCCEVTLPFFYKPFDSIGAMPAVTHDDLAWIETYAQIFARRWNAYLGDDEQMRAEAHVGAHGNTLAIEFFSADKSDDWNLKPKHDSWGYILERIGKALPQPMGTSRILLDGVVHVVTNDGIIIIKRNEKRFWTRSLAREDADATLCKAMLTGEKNQ